MPAAGASRGVAAFRPVDSGHLAHHRPRGHHREVDDSEATELMLETLFDIKVRVREIHEVVVDSEDDGEEEEEEDT